MTIDGDIKDYLLKIPITQDISERNFYIQICITHFQNVYGYLESIQEFSEHDVSEGDGILNTFAQGYWQAGFVAGETFWGFAGRLYSLWITKAIQFQEKHNKRIHKGQAYNQLGWINFNYYKNNPKAYSYYLYALIEDLISQRELYIASPAFIAITMSLFELPKEKVFEIQQELPKLKIPKMVPEDVVTKINKKIPIPTYDEISNLDSQGLQSLKSRWEKLKKEHKKN